MRKCIRCGTEMIDGLLDFYGGVGPNQLSGAYPVKAAVCPKCHEVSYYMEDETFDRMNAKLIKQQIKQKNRRDKC